eukprot:tig00021289_g19952.t1
MEDLKRATAGAAGAAGAGASTPGYGQRASTGGSISGAPAGRLPPLQERPQEALAAAMAMGRPRVGGPGEAAQGQPVAVGGGGGVGGFEFGLAGGSGGGERSALPGSALQRNPRGGAGKAVQGRHPAVAQVKLQGISLSPKCGERGTKCTVPYCTRRTGRTEEAIVKELKTKTSVERKFTDTDFPAKASSLFKDASRPTPGHIAEEHIQWCRPSQFCGPNAQLFKGAEGGSADVHVVEEGDIEAGDVIQGMLGDRWFLGALSVCATRPELMKRLWVSIKNGKEHGIYTLAFYKDDCWHVSLRAGPLAASSSGCMRLATRSRSALDAATY